MNIITKKVRLIPAPVPFVGTRIKITLDNPYSLTWGMSSLTLVTGREKAVIDWGDGNSTELTESAEVTHTYAQTGDYEVHISDDIATLRCSSGKSESPFRSIYAQMIREFHTNAVTLESLEPLCFRNAMHLYCVRCEGQGLRTLGLLTFGNCPSLSGRLDFPAVNSLAATTFSECLGITELHFGVANQEAIESLTAWETTDHKFGAANAVCKFDL